jgi:hypothetical protein
MASLLRPPLPGDEEDTRALRRQIFQTDADLTPGLISGTLTLQERIAVVDGQRVLIVIRLGNATGAPGTIRSGPVQQPGQD